MIHIVVNKYMIYIILNQIKFISPLHSVVAINKYRIIHKPVIKLDKEVESIGSLCLEAAMTIPARR